jgi:hypothetical protein
MTVDRDRRPVLIELWTRLTRRWNAAVPPLDPHELTDDEVDLEILYAQRRIRALLEGERFGWRPPVAA